MNFIKKKWKKYEKHVRIFVIRAAAIAVCVHFFKSLKSTHIGNVDFLFGCFFMAVFLIWIDGITKL